MAYNTHRTRFTVYRIDARIDASITTERILFYTPVLPYKIGEF